MSLLKETLSSNCLFHFTNSAEKLISILEKNLVPRYCLENFDMFHFTADRLDNDIELAIPMVCFCDIPLSKVKYHLSFYGNFGIGFTKEWGIKNSVSPILYIDKESATTKSIQEAIFYMLSIRTDLYVAEKEHYEYQKYVNETYLKILRLMRYLKPYQGKFWRNGQYLQDIRFYDEREWRFVPDVRLNEDDIKPWIDKIDFLDEIKRSTINSKLEKFEKYKLAYKPDDIKYIIVENDNQILSLIEALNLLTNRYDIETIKKLSSRIITRQQIIEDF